MKIDHNGFVYRTAYPFDNKPLRVSLCLLPWRFVLFGFMAILRSFCMWFIFVLIFGLIGWVIGVPLLFSVGIKPVLNIKMLNRGFGIMAEEYFEHLCILNYNFVRIKNLPTIHGKTVLPVYPLMAAGLAWAAWYAVPAAVSATPAILSGILNATITVIQSFWFPILAVVTVCVAVLAIKKFSKSEAGKLFKAYLRAKKEKICPILEVV